jgi:hypothetical protein
MGLACLVAFLTGFLLPRVASAYHDRTPFQEVITIHNDGSIPVDYLGGVNGKPEHGWRISLVATYVNAGNQNDHAYANLQVLTDGSWQPYGGDDPIMEINSISMDDTGVTWSCGKYYDNYTVSGDAWTSFEDGGSTFNLESFTYYVIVGSSNVTYTGFNNAVLSSNWCLDKPGSDGSRVSRWM